MQLSLGGYHERDLRNACCGNGPSAAGHAILAARLQPNIFLVKTFCILPWCVFAASPVLAQGTGNAATGSALPGLEPFDQAMEDLLRKWEIPGASLAVARDGRLLLARGYGFADRDRKLPVLADSVFRMGSISKTITAVAILRLVEDGRLGLDDKVLPLLGEFGPRADVMTDQRVRDITIRQLLQHTGGFDRKKSGDPIVMPRLEQVSSHYPARPL